MKKLYALTGFLILLGLGPVYPAVTRALEQPATGPVLSVTPAKGEFGGEQIGRTRKVDFTIKNSGISILLIKKIEISGSSFTLADTTHYPFEVVADSGSAFPVGNSGKSIKFSVHFKPAATGIQTGKVVITYGLYSDETREIPLTGEGLSCSDAAVAGIGENWAPRQDTWFRYTADKFSIVEINSCHPHQKPVPPDTWDFYLYGYSDCNGTLLAGGGEEMESCSYRGAAFLQTVMSAGETIWFFWPRGFSRHSDDGFYFNIKVTYPIDGDVCENAIPLTLPVINLFGNTRDVWDDYNVSPCSPFVNYMDGNDKVYSITLAEEGYLTGSILGAYASIHVLDVCPKTELTKDHCKAFAGGPNGGPLRKKIAAGTYYVIVSNWTPPQSIDYLLNLSWEGLSAVEDDALAGGLNIYPNPASGKFVVEFTGDVVADITLELVNISGQTVYRNQVKDVYGCSVEIDAGRFAKGVYYLRAGNDKELKIRKVVIE